MVAPATPIRILIVDHNEGIRRSLRLVLEQRGYVVKTAATLHEGIAQAAQASVDGSYRVAIIDVSLPDGSGIDLLATVKRLTPETTCLMVTAEPTDVTRAAAYTAGAQEYFVKPFPIAQLLEFIQRGLPLG